MSVNPSHLVHLSAEHRRSHPFSAFSKWAASSVGHPVTFAFALFLILLWVLTGPLFDYSDTWQLMINTSTTIITFLTVFLIQNTQNRDGAAVQIKLDELIRADKDAHNALINLEQLTERELIAIKNKYEHLAAVAREALRRGKNDKGSPELPM